MAQDRQDGGPEAQRDQIMRFSAEDRLFDFAAPVVAADSAGSGHLRSPISAASLPVH